MRDRFALDEGQASFYAIRDLDVDRYAIDGRIQQVLLGTRELNTDGIPNRTWVSRHLIYTHGCGVVAAPASQVTSDGRPVYFDLGVTQPQLYVGRASLNTQFLVPVSKSRYAVDQQLNRMQPMVEFSFQIFGVAPHSH